MRHKLLCLLTDHMIDKMNYFELKTFAWDRAYDELEAKCKSDDDLFKIVLDLMQKLCDDNKACGGR